MAVPRRGGLMLLVIMLQVSRPSSLRSDVSLERQLSQDSLWQATKGRIPIWLWWSYEATPPGYVVAAQKALEHFAPTSDFVIRKVNDTNIRELLPDWPHELSRTYVQAISDVARAGLLSKYGGVYLDSDMLLATPLGEITQKLDDHDMVSYQVPGQNCTEGTFSSNFMASKPGSALHTAWYEEAKAKLKSRCTAGGDEDCCYSSKGVALDQCHISWGGLGEKIGHRVLRGMLQTRNPPVYRPFCFSFEQHESFAPCIDCFWTSIPDGRGLVNKTCALEGADSLTCQDGAQQQPVYVNFFNRKAYHLFSSITPASVSHLDFARLTTGPWVFAHLFQRIMKKHL